MQRALAPVREYFSGREVSVNTVLAAYLRSNGLPVAGRPWEAAKRAIGQGVGFKEAVLLAASRPAAGNVSAAVPLNELPTPFEGYSLGWFPKQFSPGDIDGVGAKRLLGTPTIDAASVLVREMGQNSWDARGKSPGIDFILNLRLLEEPELESLRRRIFTGNAPKTGLAELLRRDKIWALEVSDRWTTGLGGPIRNDLAIEPGADTDFIDLVFNIGTPRDVRLGGGTYGFGKTISYVASSVGTILIWSRCEGFDGLEYRLIGSAIGDAFNMNGLRYTGRHWWGNTGASGGRVEPAVGDLAKELGEAVFASQFVSDATGTSILIIDPELGGDSPEKNVDLLANAVVWNLWPKLLANQGRRSRMNISVRLNGSPIEVPAIERHPVLSGPAECLLAVRAAQAGCDPADLPLRYPVTVEEIWLRRPVKLLGHLALTRYPFPPRSEFPIPSHSVTYMRHQAELVVRYAKGEKLDVEGFQWAGVFKPVSEVDDSFALSEPPAHDDWVPQAVDDKSKRSEVKTALIRIREAAERYLAPRKPSVASSEAPPSAAHVGDMLADLLGGLEGSAPSTRIARPGSAATGSWTSAGSASSSPLPPTPPPSAAHVGTAGSDSVVLAGTDGSGSTVTGPTSSRSTEITPPASQLGALHGSIGSASSTPAGTEIAPAAHPGRPAGRPRVMVVGASHTPAQPAGWTRTTLDIQLADGSPTAPMVDVLVRVGYDGGNAEDAEIIRIIGWSDGTGGTFALGPAEISSGTVRQFVFEARSDLAIDVETRLGGRL